MVLSSTCSISCSVMPLTPFLSLSSTNRDRYSGDLRFRFRKYSKSPAIICLNWRSPLNEWYRKWSKRSFRSSRFWTKLKASPLPPSSSVTRAFPCSRRYWLTHSTTVLSPSWTRLNSRNMRARSA
ncbi:unnamed protein product, partial [Ixodes hexagonus]